MRATAAAFCLGLWVMGSLFVSVVAMQNFYTVDRLLDGSSHETFRSVVSDLGRSSAREFLRYLSSELNRLFFQFWNIAQFGIGGITLALTWSLPGSRGVRGLVMGMLVVLALLTLWVTPQILTVGRSLDFVPRAPPPPALRTFGVLHATYTSLELVKCAAGVVAAFWLTRLRVS